MGMTNGDVFKWLFEGFYATRIWSLPEDQFLDWLNSDYAGRCLPEYLDKPVCQCCGKPIDHLMVDMFNYDGSDSFQKQEITFIKDSDCVCFSTSPNWTGYDLSDEERKETIICPECGKYPFDPRYKIEFSEPVDVQMWIGHSDGGKAAKWDG